MDQVVQNILVVDDQRVNLDVINVILSDSKANLHFAFSGKEALEKIYLNDYAVILLDVVMPDMGGFELAERLMQDNRTKNIPIIFISASSNNEDILYRGYQCGAVDFLFKPFNAYVLKAKVDVFLNLQEKQMKLQKLVSLEKEKKDLVRSNRDLVQFANVASHDLRSPLNRVISFTNILSDNELIMQNEEAKVCIEKIKSSSERMNMLIESILNYAQAEQTDQNMDLIDLNMIIEEVLADLELVIRKHKIIVEVEQLPKIPGHPVLFRQLFQNLISNCIKFRHPDRECIVRIEQHSDTDEENLCLVIKDNGMGFDMDKADTIFEPFKRMENTKNIEGSGLGLAAVKRIIDIHKGKIQLESEEGKSATFIFTLPKSFSDFSQKRLETRNQIEGKPIEMFCLQNANHSYQMMLVDESEDGFGGKFVGKSDLHVGKILTLHDKKYKVCWILEFAEHAYRLGLQKVNE